VTDSAHPAKPARDTQLTTSLQIVAALLLVFTAVVLPLFAGTTEIALRLLTLALAVGGAFFWFLCMVFRGRLNLPWGWPALSGAVVLAAGVMSGLRSNCPGDALVTLLTWSGYAAGFVLALWVGRDAFLRRHVLRAVCALAVPVAVYGVLQYAVLLDLTRDYIEKNPKEALERMRLTEADYPALLQRTKTKRVFATFALPNTLAAYLLLLLPTSLALATAARKPAVKGILLAVTTLVFLGLFLTFSKGGWLAGGVVLLIFLAWRGRAWGRRSWVILGSVALMALASLGVALWSSPYLRSRMASMGGELSGSAQVRRQYWAAGWSMWQAHPVLGIGPGNFANHYMQHKVPEAEEVKQAHNDYVQLLAESGPFAVLGYIAFWMLIILGSLRNLRRKRLIREDWLPATSHRLVAALVVGAGTLAILAASFFGHALSAADFPTVELGLTAGFILLWFGTYLVSCRADDRGNEAFRTSLALGLLAFALHSLVDMNLYVDGVAFTAFVLAGLAAATWLKQREFAPSQKMQIIVLSVGTISVLIFYLTVSRVAQSNSYRSYGVATKHQARHEAREALEQATVLNPLDHQAFAELASFYQAEYAATGIPARLNASATAWRRAIDLNPTFPEYRAHLARLFAVVVTLRPGLLHELTDTYRRQAEAMSVPMPGREVFLPGLVEAHRAVLCGPGKPQYRILYGQLLEDARRFGDATEQYRQALALHERMQRLSPQDLKWLRKKVGLTVSPGGAIIPE